MSRGSGRCRQEISLNDSFDHHGDTTGGALKSSSPHRSENRIPLTMEFASLHLPKNEIKLSSVQKLRSPSIFLKFPISKNLLETPIPTHAPTSSLHTTINIEIRNFRDIALSPQFCLKKVHNINNHTQQSNRELSIANIHSVRRILVKFLQCPPPPSPLSPWLDHE